MDLMKIKYRCDICILKFPVGRMLRNEGKIRTFFICNECYKKFKLTTQEDLENY